MLKGNYKNVDSFYDLLWTDDGEEGIIKDGNGLTTIPCKLSYGDFDEAHPEVSKLTGKKSYNFKITFTWGKEFQELGVMNDDGTSVIMKGMMGISTLEKISEEEAAEILADGDPVDAPPGPYKVQPEYQGKILWLTGAPGMGKSTTAQLLGRSKGFVYYEGDSFGGGRNPYIPLDVPNPSMAQVRQNHLVGEGLEQRVKAGAPFEQVMKDGAMSDSSREKLKPYYALMCEDILRERKRIGGDWAVAHVVWTREHRDLLRSKMGPKLVIVNLVMEPEELRKRVLTRHQGDEDAADLMTTFKNMCDPVEAGEPGAVNIQVKAGMTREEVVDTILEMVETIVT